MARAARWSRGRSGRRTRPRAAPRLAPGSAGFRRGGSSPRCAGDGVEIMWGLLDAGREPGGSVGDLVVGGVERAGIAGAHEVGDGPVQAVAGQVFYVARSRAAMTSSSPARTSAAFGRADARSRPCRGRRPALKCTRAAGCMPAETTGTSLTRRQHDSARAEAGQFWEQGEGDPAGAVVRPRQQVVARLRSRDVGPASVALGRRRATSPASCSTWR